MRYLRRWGSSKAADAWAHSAVDEAGQGRRGVKEGTRAREEHFQHSDWPSYAPG